MKENFTIKIETLHVSDDNGMLENVSDIMRKFSKKKILTLFQGT
jgi:hypothetical protein